MSQFCLPSETDTGATGTPTYRASDSEDESTLPFPGELPRSAFLAANFEPSTYLSTLRNRHQTLEDLRSDLRSRSQLLSKELLDLVNGNYEEFLSLGGDLRGGGEKVEEVRLGLLSFEREIQTLQRATKVRADEVRSLLAEKKVIRRDVALARTLLEIDAQVGELEESLTGSSNADDAEEEEDDETDKGYDDSAGDIRVGPLRRHTDQYLVIRQMVGRIDPGHPFLESQRNRLDKLRKTLLLDLAVALQRARQAKAVGAILSIMKMHDDLDAGTDVVKTLKGM